MIKLKLKNNPAGRMNDYRTSRMFARMLSIFGWAFLLVWIVLGLRYGITLGRELHALLVQFVWGGAPLLLVNLFLVMWLLALVMFGFMFVVAGQGMRAVFEMANSSKQLVRMAEAEMNRRAGVDVLDPELESIAEPVAKNVTEDVAKELPGEPSTD